MLKVQATLFAEADRKQKPRNEYLSLTRTGLPFKSKIRDSYNSTTHTPGGLDKFIDEATLLLESNEINTRLSDRADAREEAIQTAYFYLMQAHFYRSFDKGRSEEQKREDEKISAHYRSLLL